MRERDYSGEIPLSNDFWGPRYLEGLGGSRIVGRVPTRSALVSGRLFLLDFELLGMERRNKSLEFRKEKTPGWGMGKGELGGGAEDDEVGVWDFQEFCA